MEAAFNVKKMCHASVSFKIGTNIILLASSVFTFVRDQRELTIASDKERDLVCSSKFLITLKRH